MKFTCQSTFDNKIRVSEMFHKRKQAEKLLLLPVFCLAGLFISGGTAGEGRNRHFPRFDCRSVRRHGHR